MSKALIPLETLADEINFDLGYATSDYKFSIMRKLLEGYRQLHLYVDQEFCVKTAVLEYDNVIKMPDDFIMETKVGIERNGRIAIMTLDSGIIRQTLTQEAADVTLTGIWDGTFSGGDQFAFYNYPYTSNGLGELYGTSCVVNVNGYYNINRKLGEIYIGSLVPDDAKIIVEYKSDAAADGLTLVPVEQAHCLKFYAKWMWYADRNMGLAQMNQELYEKSYNKIQRLYNYRTALFMANTAQSYYESSPR